MKIMKNWLRTTLVTLFGFSLLSGLLAGCSRDHHADWSADDVAKVRDRIAGKMDLDAAQTQKLDALIAQLQVLRSEGSIPTDIGWDLSAAAIWRCARSSSCSLGAKPSFRIGTTRGRGRASRTPRVVATGVRMSTASVRIPRVAS